MERTYGYCRISTPTQNIERQERNILAAYPGAIIRKEAFTGTKIEGRKQFEKILREVQAGDTIVFDSVSRMSRNAEEGVKTYFELYNKGVNLIFLKEPYINTDTYKQSLDRQIEATGVEIADMYIETTNRVLMLLAERQIRIAFDQSQKEVDDLRQRTKEGIETARRAGKQIGRLHGQTDRLKVDGTVTKTYEKAERAKAQIRKKCKAFGGALNDADCMKVIGISRATYYKYKQEVEAELQEAEA